MFPKSAHPYRLLALAIILASGHAVAGGLDLPSITAAQQGTSNANGAEAADPSVIYYNPAGLALMKPGLQVSQGLTLLRLSGRVAVDQAGTTHTASPTQVNGQGTPTSQPMNGDPTSANTKSPGTFWTTILGASGLFASMPVNDMVTAGIGVFVPGGANFNYRAGWAGTYQINALALETLNINPSIGIRFDDKHSLGFGVSALAGHVRQTVDIDVQGVVPYLTKSVVDNGAALSNTGNGPGSLVAQVAAAGCPIGNTLGSLTTQQLNACSQVYNTLGQNLAQGRGFAKVEMYGYGFGFNMGYMFAPQEGTRFGLAMRSKSVMHMYGDLTWYLDGITYNSNTATVGSALTGDPNLAHYLYNNLRPNTDARGNLIIPARYSANFFHALNDKVDLMGDFTYIETSAVKEIRVHFKDQQLNGRTVKQGDAIVNTNWRNSFKVSVGGNYHYDDKLMLRTGLQYDKTPVPSDEYRHPGAPDSDRFMLSFGANYKLKKNLTIDAAYSYVKLVDSQSNYHDTCRGTTVDNPDGTYNPNGAPCTSNGGTFKGKFYDTNIHVFGVQMNQKF